MYQGCYVAPHFPWILLTSCSICCMETWLFTWRIRNGACSSKLRLVLRYSYFQKLVSDLQCGIVCLSLSTPILSKTFLCYTKEPFGIFSPWRYLHTIIKSPLSLLFDKLNRLIPLSLLHSQKKHIFWAPVTPMWHSFTSKQDSLCMKLRKQHFQNTLDSHLLLFLSLLLKTSR